MNTNEQLKPCPFCRNIARLEKVRSALFVFKYVKCQHCRAMTRLFLSEKQAIEAWNRRVNDA